MSPGGGKWQRGHNKGTKKEGNIGSIGRNSTATTMSTDCTIGTHYGEKKTERVQEGRGNGLITQEKK